jgi:hypothetical protein
MLLVTLSRPFNLPIALLGVSCVKRSIRIERAQLPAERATFYCCRPDSIHAFRCRPAAPITGRHFVEAAEAQAA